jgi:hypothetical protein
MQDLVAELHTEGYAIVRGSGPVSCRILTHLKVARRSGGGGYSVSLLRGAAPG